MTTLLSAMVWMAKGMNRVVDSRNAWKRPMVRKTLYAVMELPVNTKATKVQKVTSLTELKKGAITHACALRVPWTFTISRLKVLDHIYYKDYTLT